MDITTLISISLSKYGLFLFFPSAISLLIFSIEFGKKNKETKTNEFDYYHNAVSELHQDR